MIRQRKGTELDNLKNPTDVEIAALLDDKTEEERLARFISLSLRSMDISVEQIAQFYHEQLVNLMSSGTLKGQQSEPFRQMLIAIPGVDAGQIDVRPCAQSPRSFPD